MEKQIKKRLGNAWHEKLLIKYRAALLMIMLFIFFASGCKKNEKFSVIDSTKISQDQKALILSSKEWYTNNIDHLSKTNASTEQTSVHIGDPDWDKVAIFKFLADVPPFVVVPLNNYIVNKSYVKRMSPHGFRSLLIRKYTTDRFVTDIIEFHPDSVYIERKRLNTALSSEKDLRKLVSNDDFTGYFLVYNINNQLRHGERRENGKTVSMFKH